MNDTDLTKLLENVLAGEVFRPVINGFVVVVVLTHNVISYQLPQEHS